MDIVQEKELINIFDKADEILVRTTNKETVGDVRISLDRSILNQYCIIGHLNKEQMYLLDTKISQVKFSMDSMLKNKINHPDLNFEDYKKIKEIIIKPDEIRLSKNKRNSILLLKKDGKTYQIVIKTTVNKNENFLISFRFAEH